MKNLIIFVGFFLSVVISCYALNKEKEVEELKPVSYVDINKYMGLWYEIAKYPNKFQKDCSVVTAEYALLKNGSVSVINRCKNSFGKPKQIVGKAWVVDKNTNSKLKVQFFWPFNGDYWILDLGDNYEYAVVGEPKHKFLWILSRTPKNG